MEARLFWLYDGVFNQWKCNKHVPGIQLTFQTLCVLEQEDDINQIMDFFSYEHFYVIYCKFWELDKDHDLYISREDLARHNDHGINTLTISGAHISSRIWFIYNANADHVSGVKNYMI